jgi:hypothetical protein
MFKNSILIVFALIALVACEKSQITEPKNQTPEFSVSGLADEVKVISYCEGSCNTSETCVSKKDMVNKKYYCSCESDNCARIVEIYTSNSSQPEILTGAIASEYLDTYTTGKYLFFEELDAHVQENHNELDFRIDRVSFVSNTAGHLVDYKYTTSIGIEETVVFIYSIEKGKKIKVSCNGHCDISSQKCIEEYGFDGKVSCGCQSDNCYMEVEELGEIQGG